MMSNYRPFTEADAIEYAKGIPGLFNKEAELTSREIGDGNLNLVFHISDQKSGKSIIFKQALPYAKVVGESWPLTIDRARIEAEALRIQGELNPGLVPVVHAVDTELALIVMEDLSDHVIMRKGLIEGNRYPLFAEHIGSFLARTLFYTSDLGKNQQEKKKLAGKFINPELCKITEDLIFADPYRNADTNNYEPHLQDDVERIWNDSELHLEAAILRNAFLTHAEALLHGDLHTGSIFIKPDSTKIIDPEFAYFGPMGFDIGAVFANLLLNYAAQEGHIHDKASRADYRAYLLQTIRDIWTVFIREFTELWNIQGVDPITQTTDYQAFYLKRLLSDTAGFTGAKMVRRIIGLAHVADIDSITDQEARAKAQRIALAIGIRLMKSHRSLQTIEEIIASADLSK
jgi:5-methylthioribose kinase